LEDIVIRLSNVIEKCKTQWEVGREQYGILAELSNVDTAIGILYSFLRWIESSTSDHVHGPIVKAFLLLARNTLDISEKNIVVRTRWNYGFNYKNATSFIKPVVGDILENAQETISWVKYYLVSYPRIEKDNAFILSNLAHEAGHIFDEKQGTYDVNNRFKYKSEILGTDQAYKEASEIFFGNSKNTEAKKLGKELLDLLKKQANKEIQLNLFVKPEEVVKWRTNTLLQEKFSVLPHWIIECFADIVAARILPIPFLLSLAETLTTYKPGKDYPPNEERIRLVIEEIDEMQLTANLQQLVKENKYKHTAQIILEKINEYRKQAVNCPSGNKIEEIVPQIAWAAVKEALVPIRKFVREKISKPKYELKELCDQVELLRHGIPPNATLELDGNVPIIYDIRQILSIGWLFWLSLDDPVYQKKDCPFSKKSREDIKPKVSNLLLKAIESSSVHKSYLELREKSTKPIEYKIYNGRRVKGRVKGVLSRINMIKWMNRSISENPLIATPLFDPDQIGESSLDVRLGNVFVAFKRTRFSELKLSRPKKKVDSEKDPKRVIYKNSERIRLCYGNPFVLHPDEFVLASILEYLRIPTDLMAYVAGKSSLGRLGLVIATATQIGPGFTGSLTLELANVGTVPIKLYPGLRIAQLIFHHVEGVDRGYSGSYNLSTEPKHSGVYDDVDLEFLEFLDKSPQ